ncbi:hypothetical protein [Brevibacillus laterosporus]|uniref:hypothetical protein n=1 Tax=Brevibacillus laterosporus TaxID=1465 RepID=UPI0018CE1890|nr:hypothetical protein [Brevibacillus laterosporus]MBG9786907.1 hypothetical protein [Brevibacillus laterosporus]
MSKQNSSSIHGEPCLASSDIYVSANGFPIKESVNDEEYHLVREMVLLSEVDPKAKSFLKLIKKQIKTASLP